MSHVDEEDVEVAAAIAAGRHADDIMLFDCPACGAVSYYNEASHATCRMCGASADVECEDFNCYTLAEYWEWSPYPVDDPSRRGELL
jgi:uncharacterized OB-fold protein